MSWLYRASIWAVGVLVTAGACLFLSSLEGGRTLQRFIEVRPEPIRRGDVRTAQAIAVLGGGGHERVDLGASLHLATGLPILLVGKGRGVEGVTPEADRMAAALRTGYGIEPRWMEERSRNTYENAQYAWCTVAPLGIRRVVLVTGALHMRRARSEFLAAGFQVVAAPVPDRLPGVHARSRRMADFVPSRPGFAIALHAAKEGLGALRADLRRLTRGKPDCPGGSG